MDLIRQYIVQCITSAANNLRLNTEKIEVVSLLRECICQAGDLEDEIRNMKKVTELSKFAIKLGEVYNYIARSKVDFLKISEKFKEHCFSLVKDLSGVLEKVTPQSFRQIMKKMHETASKVETFLNEDELVNENDKPATEDPIPMQSFRQKDVIERTGEVSNQYHEKTAILEKENEKLKENFLLETDNKINPILFENYEERILNPVRDLDEFLKKVALNTASKEEIEKYFNIIKSNAELSASIGFDIIAGMHRIFARTLKLIVQDKLIPDKEIITGMRAALIVIVAVVRGKEVDITGYLNKAEELGKRIQNLK